MVYEQRWTLTSQHQVFVANLRVGAGREPAWGAWISYQVSHVIYCRSQTWRPLCNHFLHALFLLKEVAKSFVRHCVDAYFLDEWLYVGQNSVKGAD